MCYVYIYTLHYDYVIMSCYVMLCYILCIPTSYVLQGSKIGHKLMEKSEKPCQQWCKCHSFLEYIHDNNKTG